MHNFGHKQNAYYGQYPNARPNTVPPPSTFPIAGMPIITMPNPTLSHLPTFAQNKYILQHQNLNSTVDPVYYHQSQNIHPPVYQTKPTAPKLGKVLNNEEGEKLLQVWKQNNFADFNSWVQVAKAQVNIDISETFLDNSKGEKLYICNLILTFEEENCLKLMANGFGKSKKDAKKMAIERIVKDLIMNGEIKRGLKNKEFLFSGSNLNVNRGCNNDDLEESHIDQLQKKIHKMAKRMQECLKRDDFIGACEILCLITVKKKPDWNEVSFIWCYALLKRNLSYLRSIIDLIQYKKLVDEDLDIPPDETIEATNEKEEKVKQELLDKYGTTRLKSNNLYEIIDTFNFEVSLPEISSKDSEEITEEESAAEIIAFPMARDLNNVLVPYQDITTSQNQILKKPEEPSTPKDSSLSNFYKPPQPNPPSTTHPLQPPPSINLQPLPTTNMQPPPPIINQPPPSLTIQPPPIPLQTQNISVPFGAPISNTSLYNPSPKQDLNGWTVYHQSAGWPKAEKPPEPGIRNTHYPPEPSRRSHLFGNPPEPPKLIYGSIPQPPGKPNAPNMLDDLKDDLVFTKELRDPETTYLSYKLLEELYDSLMYVGDMNFAITTAEALYSRIKLSDDDFMSSNACYYYAHRRNMIAIELIESMFQPIIRSKHRITEYSATVEGVVEKIGNKYAHEVVQFTPIEPLENIKAKISKTRITESRDNQNQIAEGEFLMLISVKQSLAPEINFPGREDLDFIPREYGSLEINSQNVIQKPAIIKPQFKNQEQLRNLQNRYHEDQAKRRKAQQEEEIEVAMIACVREISKDYIVKLYVLPTKEQSEAILQAGRVWKITKLANKTLSERMTEALETFTTKTSMTKPLAQIVLSTPSSNSVTIKQLAESTVQLPYKAHPPFETNLNLSQKKALQMATSQILTLIQGPPGSGKTTVAIEIVLEWLRQSSIQILVCSDSNIGADRIHTGFLKAGVKSIRIGPGYENIEPPLTDKHHSIKQPFSPTNMRSEMMIKMIRQAQVVCTTCLGCISEYLKPMGFQRVLIVEAAQILEATCLMSLVKGCQQLVLIGDHKGLSPQATSLWAQSKGMGISLFERLVKQGIQPQLLSIQYRIHSSLSYFPSYRFYGCMLENGVADSLIPVIYGFRWPNPGIRVAFINVKGEEKVCSSSIQNPKEVEVVVEVLMHLMKNGYNQMRNIGILTAYEAQKKRIRNEVTLKIKRFPQIFGLMPEQTFMVSKTQIINDIDVIQSFPGLERDLIIFSAVRSNKLGNLGILRDPRRMNTVLTRAKQGLIVIVHLTQGNIETLNKDKNWSEWIQWCKTNKLIFQYI